MKKSPLCPGIMETEHQDAPPVTRSKGSASLVVMVGCSRQLPLHRFNSRNTINDHVMETHKDRQQGKTWHAIATYHDKYSDGERHYVWVFASGILALQQHVSVCVEQCMIFAPRFPPGSRSG